MLGRRAFTLVELLVVCGIIILLLAMALPAIQRIRASSDKLACQNKLHQMGVAFHLYHSDFQRLPPGVTDFSDPFSPPMPFLAWSARLLPYLEMDDIWKQITLNYQTSKQFVTAPHLIRFRPLALFRCPTEDREKMPGMPGLTSYLGNTGLSYLEMNGTLYTNSKVRWTDVHDGLSHTLLVGERPPNHDGSLGWWYAGMGQEMTGSLDTHLGVREVVAPSRGSCPYGPIWFRPDSVDNYCAQFHFWSLHQGGAFFLFADGSVRFLAYSADPIMPALATRAGNETIALE